jgi:hypothetical protein
MAYAVANNIIILRTKKMILELAPCRTSRQTLRVDLVGAASLTIQLQEMSPTLILHHGRTSAFILFGLLRA